MGEAVVQGAIGELFHMTVDAVLILEDGAVVAANAASDLLFRGASAAEVAQVCGPLLALADGAPVERVALPSYGVVDVVRRVVGGRDVLLLRDVTADVRRNDGLRRLATLTSGLLARPPVVAELLQLLVGEAKTLTGAAYSALLLLRPGSQTETSHFVYDAPRHLFPTRMPRVVGLLAVPLALRGAARLDDIRGHPAGVGLPGVHPPIGPLLAVPLLAGDEVIGELAVANPPDTRVFDEVDEALLVDLAAHASTSVRWAQGVARESEESARRQEVVDTARHDIRTPLGAGKGYAALLSTRMARMSPEQVQTALEGLRTSFDRIESFTARLLVDERQAVTGVEPAWATVDVQALLEQVRRDADVTTGREDAVQVVLGPDAPRTLAGDPEMVREVVDNLVGNALKHSGGAAVAVTVRSEGDHVRFDVRDEGPGIAEADQAGLFERWARAGAARDGLVPGFGLGLSIVHRLVTAHGGLAGVSSRPGEGATFWVTFPREVPA